MRVQRKVFNLYKTIQAIHYLLNQCGKTPYMKVLKLIYLADRYHLRHYGIGLTGDEYKAMKFGSVGSQTMNVVKENDPYFYMLGEEDRTYYRRLLGHEGYDVWSEGNCEYGELSVSEKEALDFVLESFGGLNQFDLAAVTHDYPEWKNVSVPITSGEAKVVDENMVDFFEDPDLTESPEITRLLNGRDPFQDDPEVLEEIRDYYVEMRKDP